jgi:hypothetical protein
MSNKIQPMGFPTHSLGTWPQLALSQNVSVVSGMLAVNPKKTKKRANCSLRVVI